MQAEIGICLTTTLFTTTKNVKVDFLCLTVMQFCLACAHVGVSGQCRVWNSNFFQCKHISCHNRVWLYSLHIGVVRRFCSRNGGKGLDCKNVEGPFTSAPSAPKSTWLPTLFIYSSNLSSQAARLQLWWILRPNFALPSSCTHARG